jgi:hypothetical protein
VPLRTFVLTGMVLAAVAVPLTVIAVLATG